MTWKWSDEQIAIFDAVAHAPGEHIVVTARAGAAKTTSAIEAVARSPYHRVMMLVYNKDTAEDLQKRLVKGEARTSHALGFRLLKQAKRATEVDKMRPRRLAEQALKDCRVKVRRESLRPLTELIDLAKEARPTVSAAADLKSLVEGSGLDLETSTPADRLAEVVFHAMALARSTKDGKISFADMVWLPVVEGLVRPLYDEVVIDEAQDQSRAQLHIAFGVCADRIIMVGDSKQCIYSWRGADSGSMERVREALRARALTLTTTFRCARKVVEKAQTLVPDIRAREGAPEGVVRSSSFQRMLAELRPGDFVLSRVNAPLIGVCLDLLRREIPSTISGTDIGQALARLVESLGKGMSAGQLKVNVAAWASRERARVASQDDDARAVRAVNDKEQAILVLASGLQTVDEVIARIDALFSAEDDARVVTCATVFAAKGRERERVFLLEDSFLRKQRVNGEVRLVAREGEEEDNIRYVAYTRAKNELVLVEGGA